MGDINMIKILFVHNKLVCGGAEQALFDLVSLMDKTKFDITVLVQYDGGIWEDKFRHAGIRVISIWDCQKRSFNPLVKIQNQYKRKYILKALENNGEGLLDVCVKEDFDIIVSYNGSTLQNMYFTGKAKTIKYIHGDIGTNEEFRKNIMTILDSIRKFDRIICVSHASMESFKKRTCIEKRVVCHFNPLNSENVHKLSIQEVDVPNAIPYICAVGRLAPEKGYDRLIRIHKNLLNMGIYHQMVIVGDGPEKDKLLQLIADEHVEESVFMVGYQTNPYPFILNSKFLVCSSYTEGLPVIAMEALALGIPIVSSAPSIEEAFGTEECGVITQNDEHSLELGIRKMLTDEEFYRKTKREAEKRSRFFDGKCMVKEVEEEFITLVK